MLLYNDAWRPIVGDKHPWSLGRPGREVWPEIWNDIGPEFAKVLATGEGIFHSDELLAMHRFGYTEECFFDYTFNPIQGKGGVIDGILNIVSETTYRVLNDRRARLLREVASKTGTAKTVEEACEGADVVLHCTEWEEYRRINPAELRPVVKTPAIIDGRRTVRVSIGAVPTEREHVEALWALMRAEAER